MSHGVKLLYSSWLKLFFDIKLEKHNLVCSSLPCPVEGTLVFVFFLFNFVIGSYPRDLHSNYKQK